MAITWADISTITLFFSLAALLLGKGFAYLLRRDAEEGRRNRQDACSPHRWVRDGHTGLICGLCGKIPG
ncbi:MAG: hypothetical protein HY575_03325 [candidate division NC10 bacterium]|nr:hypothetical protein [candidate division NC10 bacterium]MBI4390890.1 hypothetical protein [candidate division NC10 bacterium]